MNKEIKEKWVGALRSHTYKQGKNVLRDGDNKFCCLGVLCDVVDPAQWRKTKHYSREDFSYYGEICTLPLTISKEYGISRDLVNQLIGLNDFEHASFEEIADYIEENL